MVVDVVIIWCLIWMRFLLLTLSRFHVLFWCFDCWLWEIKYRLGRKYSPGVMYLNLFVTNMIFYKDSKIDRGGSRAVAASKVELLVIIVNRLLSYRAPPWMLLQSQICLWFKMHLKEADYQRYYEKKLIPRIIFKEASFY